MFNVHVFKRVKIKFLRKTVITSTNLDELLFVQGTGKFEKNTDKL